MSIELNLSFWDLEANDYADGVDGYQFGDFFKPGTLEKAEAARNTLEARQILISNYLGADTLNVGIKWRPVRVDD